MAKQRAAGKRTTPRRSKTKQQRTRKTKPTPRAKLAVLVYLCGDNHIEKDTITYRERILGRVDKNSPTLPKEKIRAIAHSEMHIVVQHDQSTGCERFLKFANTKRPVKREVVERDVDTGNPAELFQFLEWGIENAPADGYVLILSGLGVNTRYIRQALPLWKIPEGLHDIRKGSPSDNESKDKTKRTARSGDPNAAGYRKAFANALDKLSSKELAKYRELVHDQMFSICHDFSDSGSLKLSELGVVLTRFVDKKSSTWRIPKFDLIVLDVGAAAFVEVLFELEGIAEAVVASQRMIPDKGWPYQKILEKWDDVLTTTEEHSAVPLSHQLATELLNILKADSVESKSVVAVNMDALDEVARVLDAVAIALLHSLGDWHVLDAVLYSFMDFFPTDIWINNEEPGPPVIEFPKLDDIEIMPAVDLFVLLNKLEASFNNKVKSENVPTSFGQWDRVSRLHELICRTISHLRSKQLVPYLSTNGGLFLDNSPEKISILFPPIRTQTEIEKETGKMFSLSRPSYARLNFSQRVHWSALFGAVQMIHEKPHAVWRVVSSMLADASGPARDAALGRLISDRSVVGDLRLQFRSLGESESLELSLDPIEESAEVTRYLVRLESVPRRAVIWQQESRVYQDTLNSTLDALTGMMRSPNPEPKLRAKFKSLGSILGEDIIRDLRGELRAKQDEIAQFGDGIPHLALKLHRKLMRYPWELTSIGDEPIGLRFAMGRQVYMDGSAIGPVSPRESKTIRVLVVGDPKLTREFVDRMASSGVHFPSLVSARNEARTVTNAFKRLNDEMAGIVRIDVDHFINKHVTTNDIRRYIRKPRYDIIHFAGHAKFEPNDPEGSAWILSDGFLRAQEIRNTLTSEKRPPWLVFANACEAGMDAARDSRPSDVTGLATAFISQGVAAYVAPLWPVDDELACWMAVRFYRELLQNRFSVGEALRIARNSVWEQICATGDDQTMPSRTAMTWASFVLYGDPTARLLQSLWTPEHEDEKTTSDATSRRKTTRGANYRSRSRSFRQPIAAQIISGIDFPKSLRVARPRRDVDGQQSRHGSRSKKIPFDAVRLQLAERFGIRYWRASHDPVTRNYFPLSTLGEFLESKTPESAIARQAILRMISHDRGQQVGPRSLKTWILKDWDRKDETARLTSLSAEFDCQQVPRQEIFRSRSELERTEIDSGDWLSRPTSSGQMNRAVLFIHGTFSRCQPMISDFARRLDKKSGYENDETESMMSWMRRRYRAVLGFDHWTLSQSPKENAEWLAKELIEKFAPSEMINRPIEIDIICHGRGGLIARSLTELLLPKTGPDPKLRIGRIVFVGVPNAGTSLASCAKWGQTADILVNLASLDPTGWLGRLSGFMAWLATQQVGAGVPGLQVMDPDNLCGNGSKSASFLQTLIDAKNKPISNYYVVASNYSPPNRQVAFSELLARIRDHFPDCVANEFFAAPNDLVVDTASMWSFDRSRNWKDSVNTKLRKRLLLFNCAREGPAGILTDPSPGIHHANYFLQPKVREFIRASLDR